MASLDRVATFLGLRHEPLEAWKHVVFDQDGEIVEYTSDFVAPDAVGDGSSPVERYMRKELQIWVRLGLRPGVLNHSEYLMVFECLAREHKMSLWRFFQRPPVRPESVFVDRYRDQNYSMLVDVVQIPQKVQPSIEVPSVVRLYCIEDSPHVVLNSAADVWQTHLMASIPGTSRRVAMNGKRGMPIGVSGELVGQMIKRTPKVMETVSDDGTPIGHIGRVFSSVDMLKTVTLNLWREGISPTFHQGPEFLYEAIGMETRSIYFDLDAVERGLLPPPPLCQ